MRLLVPLACPRLVLLPLLAAVMATALLSAGEARATLLNQPANCDPLSAERSCVGAPVNVGVLDTLWTVADLGTGGDPLFNFFATETNIILFFTEFVTERLLEESGFNLSGLQSIPGLVPGELDVTFLGEWNALPDTRPFVTDDLGAVEWTRLTNADPRRERSAAVIHLQFVPEPGTTVLLGLGIAGLAVVGRSRRN